MKNRPFFRLLMFLVVASGSLVHSFTQDVQYISAGLMIDGLGGTLENPRVKIEGDRIVEVGISSSVQIAPGAKHVDLGSATLLPGFIDLHVHINGSASEFGYKSIATSSHRAAIRGVKNAKVTLMTGFTTIRNVGAGSFVDVALRDAIHAGDVPGPRMKVSGPSLGVTGGHCDNNLFPAEWEVVADGIADGPWAVRAKVRENIKYGADLIKFCATGGVLSKGTKVGIQQYTAAEMEAIVDEAHMRGLRVAAHAHGTSGIKAAIRAGVDTIEHASFLDDEAIQLAKDHGTFLSMDIYNTEYILSEGAEAGILPESLDKERQVGARQRESFRRAVAAGAKVVFGSDAAVYPHGQNGQQFSRMVRFGMTPMQAIRAATGLAAEALGWGEVGAVQAGRFADLVAVQGNPIENIEELHEVDFVMKGGVVYKNELR